MSWALQKQQLALKTRKQCKKYAGELQMEYRFQLAKAKEAEDNIPAAIHVKNLTQQENTRRLYRRIRYLERKLSNLSTSRLLISDRDGRQKEILHKTLIEKHILAANERKYHQTEGHSTLTQGQLLRDMGQFGNGPQVQSILDGTYNCPHGTTTASKDFIAALKYPLNFHRCDPISFRDFKEGWMKAKEKTSSCGPHFGHYKAAMHHTKLATLFYQRAMIPMITGYSPRRHRTGVDVMLLKKENNYHVDSLRTIVLFDSEANMNYKHIGRRAMQSAISSNQIATEQYSRPQRRAIDHALNRKLVMDHQLYKRQPYAITSCDLKSCYDRILHNPASISLQRIGIPRTEVVSMFDSIQRMRHSVRTTFGDSILSYGGDVNTTKWKSPPQGVLQGNGCGPAIWSILSSVIFSILRKKGCQNRFVSPIRKMLLRLAGFAYVDDSDLIHADETTQRVIRGMQRKLNQWIDTIGVTGGILAPLKCWWYLVTYKYKLGKWKAVSPQTNAELRIRTTRQRTIAVQHVDTSKGMNMLGVYLAPDGNMNDEVQHLRQKAEQWAQNITVSHANQEEVWTALHHTIPFAMCYPLPASTLSKDQCTYMMAPIHKVGLPKAGITATIPAAVRNGPITRGGLGIVDTYTHMGVSQLQTLISHLWKGTPTGILLEIALDDLALEMGLQDTWNPITLQQGFLYATTPSWIRHVLQFSLEHSITLSLDRIMFLPRRSNDCTIMESALTYSTHPATLKSINRVRMALNIIWLSDMTTADGCQIDKRWTQRQDIRFKRNDCQWPHLHHIRSQDWTIWRAWIGSICQWDNVTLRRPLGDWQGSIRDWIEYWEYFITPNSEELYIKQQNPTRWHRHIIQPGRHRHFSRYFCDYLVYADLPVPDCSLSRVSITSHRHYIEVHAINARPGQWQEIDTSLPNPWNNINPTKHSICQRIRELLQPVYLETSEQLHLLFQDFTHGQTVAVNDGSYFPTTSGAAAAWIIESKCGTQWIQGSVLTPGPREVFSAYRSELTGLLAISVTLRILASTIVPAPNHTIIGCDGQAALNILSLKRDDISANTPHADLCSMIIDIWRSVNMLPLTMHIKGHQDVTGRCLNRLEQLNVMMDHLARMTAELQPTQARTLSISTIGIPQVQYGTHPIPGDFQKTLYTKIKDAAVDNYYEQRIFGNTVDISCIDFVPLAKARKRAPTSLNIFISKWLSNTLATGVIMQKRKHRIFNRCPRCNEWGEDRIHIITCWDVRANLVWKQQMTSFKQLLKQQQTCPVIEAYLTNGLERFRRRPHAILPERESWKQEISQIGWINMMSGFIGHQVIRKQQEYYRTIGSRKYGTNWASRIIFHWWIMIHHMWLNRNDILHKKTSFMHYRETLCWILRWKKNMKRDMRIYLRWFINGIDKQNNSF